MGTDENSGVRVGLGMGKYPVQKKTSYGIFIYGSIIIYGRQKSDIPEISFIPVHDWVVR